MMESNSIRAACVQLTTCRDVEANVSEASRHVRAAVADGATYVQTPEQTALMELDRGMLFSVIRSEADDPALAAFRALSAELGIWLHVGSLAIRVSRDKAANRGFLLSPDGAIAARYDKIHMFDVDLAGGESYLESLTYRPGNEAVVADMAAVRLGLSICYDLRFAALYRAYAKAGAHMLTVPAAFTKTTGEAHWHVLLRSRAIENGAFVVAAAQGGRHDNGRDTYGHSMIIDPWGKILAEADDQPGHIVADLDPVLVEDTRSRIQALRHDRPWNLADTARAELRTAS